MTKIEDKTTAEAKTKKEPESFETLLAKFLDAAASVNEPQDLLNGKLIALQAQLQAKEGELFDLTRENPDGEVEPIFDEIQKLKKQISIVKLQLKAYPDNIDRDLKSVLQRAYAKSPDDSLVVQARDVRDTGIKDMSEIQKRIDKLVRKDVPEIEKLLSEIAETVGDLERKKFAMAGKILDVDYCLPKDERKRVTPRPAVSWSDCVIDEDVVGKHFGAEIPSFKYEFGESLGITK